MWDGGAQEARARGITTSQGGNWATLSIELGLAQTRQLNTKNQGEYPILGVRGASFP